MMISRISHSYKERERDTQLYRETAASATDFLCRHFVSQNGATSPCCFNYRKFCWTFCSKLPKDPLLLQKHALKAVLKNKSIYYVKMKQESMIKMSGAIQLSLIIRDVNIAAFHFSKKKRERDHVLKLSLKWYSPQNNNLHIVKLFQTCVAGPIAWEKIRR